MQVNAWNRLNCWKMKPMDRRQQIGPVGVRQTALDHHPAGRGGQDAPQYRQ